MTNVGTPIARWLQKHISEPLDRMYARLDDHATGAEPPHDPATDASASDAHAPVHCIRHGHDRAA